MKYLTTDKRTGKHVYRRRVPKILSGMVTEREFLKVLGQSFSEAIVQYGSFHERIEHLVSLAKNGVTGLSASEQRLRLISLLETWGADPFGSGVNENERTWREEAADKLVGSYQDPDRGTYEGVPEEAATIATALLSGVPKGNPQPTISDAFKFYLSENAKALPEQKKKQVQRFMRAERNLVAVVKGDPLVSHLTRADVRAWRDMREGQGAAPTTIRREKNDISAVISFANSELDAGQNNPFRGLQIKKAMQRRQEERMPLDQSTIDGVYDGLGGHKELQQIWTLLDFTGARPSEIRMLTLDEIVVDHEVPHIVIQEREDRTLKTGWSTRKVPLVGAGLIVGHALVEQGQGTSFAFPGYADGKGMDRLSQALSKRVRRFSKDPKHVPYSLRHNMKDRMRQAEVFPETARAIEGHSYGGGQDASYGGAIPLEQMKRALEKALVGYREER